MTDAGWIALASGIFSLVLIPLAVLVIRGAVKWTQIEDRLNGIVGDLQDLIKQVREERAALDRRLRWLEENVWRRQQRQQQRRDPPS